MMNTSSNTTGNTTSNNNTRYLYHSESKDLYQGYLENHKKCLQVRNIRPFLDLDQSDLENVHLKTHFEKHIIICPICESAYKKEMKFRNFISEKLPMPSNINIEISKETNKSKNLEYIFSRLVQHEYYTAFWSKRNFSKKINALKKHLKLQGQALFQTFFNIKTVVGVLLGGFIYFFLKLIF